MKVGLDDFFAAGRSVDDLLALRIPVIVSSDSGRNVSTDSGAS